MKKKRVILDTSAFIALREVEQLDLLEELFNEIIIPPGVFEEIGGKKTLSHFIELKKLTSEQVQRAKRFTLHKGESQAIILSEDLSALLLIDENNARKTAKEQNIPITGTFGLFRQAYKICILTRTELKNTMNDLKQDLFYEDWLIDHVLSAKKKEK